MKINIFDRFKKQDIQLKTEDIKPFDTTLKTFNINIDYSQTSDYLNRTANGYLYGVNGLFPQELNKCFHQSPLHAAIINFKKLLTTGNGYSIDSSGLDGMGKISLNQLTSQFDTMLNEIAMDYFIHSRV